MTIITVRHVYFAYACLLKRVSGSNRKTQLWRHTLNFLFELHSKESEISLNFSSDRSDNFECESPLDGAEFENGGFNTVIQFDKSLEPRTPEEDSEVYKNTIASGQEKEEEFWKW